MLRVASACATFWWVHGHWTEGRRWLDLALAQPLPQEDRLRAKALEGAAHLAMRQLDCERASDRPRRALGAAPATRRPERGSALIASSSDNDHLD